MSPMKIHETILVGDVARMRKPHACGGDIWKVHRTGADIGMTCCRCGRRVMMSRRHFAHRMQCMLQRGMPPVPDEPAPGVPPP